MGNGRLKSEFKPVPNHPQEHRRRMTMTFIDLRSDTVTLPTETMRKAISSAALGDDVFGEDPTVNRLQDMAARLLGKEAALFVPSGTMANQLSVRLHTRPGDEIIVDAGARLQLDRRHQSAVAHVQRHARRRGIARAAGRLRREAPLEFGQIPRNILHRPVRYMLGLAESSKYPTIAFLTS